MTRFLRNASILFAPIRIGNATIPNRFVRSATHDYMAEEDGSITDRNVSLFRTLAEGEVGLIITGHAYVHPSGKASPRQIGIYEDRFVEGLSRLTSSVHHFSARIFLQIAHAGRQTKEKLCGCIPLSPSAVYEPVFKVRPKEMTLREIDETIDAFIQAARRAREAGFDGVQLHVAHGYLLSSFISPHTNRRQDDYGGTLRKRVRVVSEIVRGIKKAAGGDYPVILKLNSSDFLEGGLTLFESIEIARLLEADGVDGIEASGGMSEAGKGSVWQGLRPEEEEGYFLENAALIKAAVKVPVFGLGGFRSFLVMERAVRSGKVDLISMARPFIREPYLVHKFKTGEIDKSECVSCNKCFNLRGIRCAEHARMAK